MSDPTDVLPDTQKRIVRLLRSCSEATLHTLAWHTRLYQGAAADEAYRAVQRLEDAGDVETEELTEAPNRRGARRVTAALTRQGALKYDVPEALHPSFRPTLYRPQAWRALRRQLAVFTMDYVAAGWRSASGEAAWTALRAELQQVAAPRKIPTGRLELLPLLLRRTTATVGTWSVVSPSGHVRLVLMADTLSAMRSLLRHLNTDLLACVSALMPLEFVVLGPTESVEKTMVKLVRRWAAPPPKRRVRVSADGINPSVRTGGRMAVAVRVETHARYEDLPYPKAGGALTVHEMVETRQNHATKWEYYVALIMTPEHPLGIRETELSPSERRWPSRRDGNRPRRCLSFGSVV